MICLFLNTCQLDNLTENGDVLLGDFFGIAGVLDRDKRVEYRLEELKEKVDDGGQELAMMVRGGSTMAYYRVHKLR